MKTDYGHTVAENAIILAENSDYCVWKWQGWFFLSGLGETRFVYTSELDWNRLASVIIEATEKMGGVKQRETDDLKDLLIDIDSWHELLGTELLEAFHEGCFDPDANFTPLEHRLKLLYKALGFNEKEIREEAYKLSKKRLGEEE